MKDGQYSPEGHIAKFNEGVRNPLRVAEQQPKAQSIYELTQPAKVAALSQLGNGLDDARVDNTSTARLTGKVKILDDEDTRVTAWCRWDAPEVISLEIYGIPLPLAQQIMDVLTGDYAE